MNRHTVQSYINQYKANFEALNRKEIYKWRAVKQFQTNWNLEEIDFAEMLERSLKFAANLLDSNNTFPNKMVCRNAQISPEFVRQLFRNLYNEEIDLTERIKQFRTEFKSINHQNFVGKNDYQGQRAVIVYLTLRYPERYYFYKFGMFKSFIEIVDYPYKPVKGRYENINQFKHLCDLVKFDLENDQELIKLHKERISPDCYYDKNLNILTQDFIYSVVKHLPSLEIKPLDHSIKVDLLEMNTSNIQLDEIKTDFTPSSTNHIQNNIENKRIGDLGELWVIKYENEKLLKANKPKLAMKIEHTAKSRGDGTGYDILSFDKNGNKMLIEVKSTKGKLNSTFFITRNELARSIQDPEIFYLYRLYEFNEENNTGKLLILHGNLSKLCGDPKNYIVKLSTYDSTL